MALGNLNDPHFAIKSHQRSIQVTDLANTSGDQYLRKFEYGIPFQLASRAYRNERVCNPLCENIDPFQGE